MKKRALTIQYAGLAIALIALAWMACHFPILRWIGHAQRWVQSLGPASVLAYPLLYALCNVFLLPAGVLVVGAGFCFGLWTGILVVLIGNLLGAALAFAISRTVARRWVERKMLANPRWRAMDEVIGEKGGRIVFLSQLHPLFPTSLLNYFYGITRLPFWSCMGWIALGQLPGVFLYVYLGTIGQFGVQMLHEKSRFQLGESGLWIAGFLAALGITIALARLSVKLLHEIDERASAMQLG